MSKQSKYELVTMIYEGKKVSIYDVKSTMYPDKTFFGIVDNKNKECKSISSTLGEAFNFFDCIEN